MVFNADAAVALARNDIGNHRSLAAGRDILPVGLPGLPGDRGAGVPIEQIGRTSRRLRAHLRESRDGELIVDVPRDDLLELHHAIVDAAGGWRIGRLERADRTVPDQDVALAHDEIVGLDVRRHFQDAGIAGRLLRVEPENAAVDLVEHEQVALLVGGERLRSGQLHVFSRGGDTDRRGSATSGELPHHGVGSRGSACERSNPSHHDGSKQPLFWKKHAPLSIQQFN
jgi:hypothetical protein